MNDDILIGLEVHVQLSTKTKMWCGCKVVNYALENSKVCEICSGQPGTLPVFNKKVRDFAIQMGLATHCEINLLSFLDRKNYFYPDLPKGYQITQYETPICQDGYLNISLKSGEIKRIGIERIQIEEDTGKSIHDGDSSLINLNRAGVPLLEIVSRPDMVSAEEATSYLKKIHSLLTYLGISHGSLQDGNMRCDVNISITPKGSVERGTRTETKNLNSFRSIENLIEVEAKRQRIVLSRGEKVIQQTFGFDVNTAQVKVLRTKSDADDYRYFPEPDLLPLVFDQELVHKLENQLPELPDEKRDRFVEDYKLSSYDVNFITSSRSLADYFEEAVKFFKGGDAKKVVNWIMVELYRLLNEFSLPIEKSPISPEKLSGLLNFVDDGIISGKMAKEVFQKMFDEGRDALSIIEQFGLRQTDDEEELTRLIETVIGEKNLEVERYKNGEKKLFRFFIGEVMKLSKGRANPQKVNQILKKLI